MGSKLRERHGITLLVLAAKEFQPPAEKFSGVRVLHIPLDDDPRKPPTEAESRGIHEVGHEVAREVKRGGKALVTCAVGLNRSGLVSATALRFLGMTGRAAADFVQAAREGALSNPSFYEWLSQLPALGTVTRELGTRRRRR